jgi:hypothetical protein
VCEGVPRTRRRRLLTTIGLQTLKETIMDKDVAKALLTLSKSIDGVIVQMFAEVDKIDDQGLKSRFNDSVGNLLGLIARDLIFRLENLYPELREGD